MATFNLSSSIFTSFIGLCPVLASRAFFFYLLISFICMSQTLNWRLRFSLSVLANICLLCLILFSILRASRWFSSSSSLFHTSYIFLISFKWGLCTFWFKAFSFLAAKEAPKCVFLVYFDLLEFYEQDDFLACCYYLREEPNLFESWSNLTWWFSIDPRGWVDCII